MAQPITWRNVDAPDLRGAAGMLNLAQHGFNSGFDQLNNVLKTEQATAENNWKIQRDNNTQAFLNSINQYRTPEEYQAALASGALDAGKYGAQIDQAAARSALDGRLSILQDRTTKANQFTDQQKERDARPIVDRLNTMALSEDKDVRRIDGVTYRLCPASHDKNMTCRDCGKCWKKNRKDICNRFFLCNI